MFADNHNIRLSLSFADLLIGAVLVPGAKAPRLVTRPMLALMKQGAVLVDVAIDQGGLAETSRPTTHVDPIYIEEGVVHYTVANMPGAVPRTATRALTLNTLPYVLAIAQEGWRDAARHNRALARGRQSGARDGYAQGRRGGLRVAISSGGRGALASHAKPGLCFMHACLFRPKATSDYDAERPPVLIESAHPVWSNPTIG
jgi:hypothetical protein